VKEKDKYCKRIDMVLLEDLNKEQQDAVRQKDGPIIIIAGAGSGKTRTLTYRIAYLIEQGVSPYNIMSLTFTNKAAKEMQERIYSLVGYKAKYILMGTFHSIFSRILRQEAEKIGYTKNYSIYDDTDSKRLISEIIKNLNLDPKNYSKGRVLNRISFAKCSLYSPQDYKDNEYIRQEDFQANIGEVYRVYQVYQSRLKQAMAMDFDDILFNMNVLLRDFVDVKEKYQKRFQYILVDEYQDTNYSQYLIVKKLAEYYKNICVVGDDAQSIYSFRGATIQNILNFRKDYPNANIYKLEQNYRSTQNIIKAANSVIVKNELQIPKIIWTNNEDGDKLLFKTLLSDREEADWVAEKIKEITKKDKVDFNDMAILYRTNSQSRALEDSLRLKNIPYIVYGGISFYGRKEIKDAVAYLRLVANNDDDEAFERVINYPARGIGKTSIDRLKILRGEKRCSLFATIKQISENKEKTITTHAVKAMQEFCDMIEALSLEMKTTDAFTLGDKVIKRSGIMTDLALMKDVEDKDKLENIQELLNSIKSFVENDEENIIDSLTGEEISIKDKTLDVFLQQISLMSTADEKDEENSDNVKLMTIHSAKGLEFNTVFIVGMEENLFPSCMSFASRDDIEEERRLFYVAITRAKQHLFLSCAKMRYQYGNTTFSETSRFIKEIDSEFIDCNDGDRQIKKRLPFNDDAYNEPKKSFSLTKKKPLTSLRDNVFTEKILLRKKQQQTDVDEKDLSVAGIDQIKEGMNVYHSKFGNGVVVGVEGERDNKKARVDFETLGEKTLILKFAKLKIKK
jgi:DNA helicase-2/ATP-dependent DNA helicase PcrA